MTSYDNGKLKMIVQAGAVGIAILLIALIYILIKSYNLILYNDLQHIGEYIRLDTEAKKSIEKTIEANTKQNERLEQAINRLEYKLK